MCYMDPNCVSINFGPSHGEKYKCELNNATDEDHLTARKAFIFLAIEVNILMPELCVSIVSIFFTFKEIGNYHFEISPRLKR